MSWGLRLYFPLSAVLIVIGVFVRSWVKETPEAFQALEENKSKQAPLVEVVRTGRHWYWWSRWAGSRLGLIRHILQGSRSRLCHQGHALVGNRHSYFAPGR